MNFKKLKEKFPIFKKQVNGHPLVYLDSASTAQMPESVIQAIVAYYTEYKANVGRGLYSFAEEATEKFERSRKTVANFIGASKEEVIFTSGATQGINKVAHSWAFDHIEQGDEILVTEIEHHSNFVPWQQLAQDKGAVLKVVPVNNQGLVNHDTFEQYLSDKTKLVAMIHMSNMLGTTQDVKALTKLAHQVGAKVLVDASQSVVHQKIDVKDINCDFLVFSGHKLFGPTGVGVLFIKKDLFDQCKVSLFGGGMVFSVQEQHTSFKQAPYCFEAGTQPIAQVIGLAAAIDFVDKEIDFNQLQKHETYLATQLYTSLSELDTIQLMSPLPKVSGNVVTFISSDYHAHDIAAFLDQYGIAVRAGHHCVQPYHLKHGVNASVRASFSVYNTQEDVDQFMNCFTELVKK